MGEKIVKKLIDEDQERNGVFKIFSHSSIFFSYFKRKIQLKSTYKDQIIVQWVEFNINRPFVYTFCENLRHVKTPSARFKNKKKQQP